MPSIHIFITCTPISKSCKNAITELKLASGNNVSVPFNEFYFYFRFHFLKYSFCPKVVSGFLMKPYKRWPKELTIATLFLNISQR